MSRALDGRESGVQALVEGLDGSLTPTDTEWSHTVESVAGLVQSGEIDATWDGFLTSLLEVLPSELIWKPRADTEDALKSARFLPDQDGRLISVSDEARVFFQPVIGIHDAADLVDTVPHSLKQRIAFIHRDVRTHDEGAEGRPYTSSSTDRFAGGFGGRRSFVMLCWGRCHRCRLRSVAVTLICAQNSWAGRSNCSERSHRRRSCHC